MITTNQSRRLLTRFAQINAAVAIVSLLALVGSANAQPIDLSSADITASSIFGLGLEADKAFDNDPATRWASANPPGTYPDWIFVDLGATYQIDRVDLSWRSESTPGAYELFVSGTGVDPGANPVAAGWTSIGSVSGRAGPTINLSFDEIWNFDTGAWTVNNGTGTPSGLTLGTGNFLLMYATSQGGSNGLTQIQEVDVYVTAIPEPSSFLFAPLGLGLVGMRRRRNRCE